MVAEIKGRYSIESKLGQGGMGSVYLARDKELDRKVAVKLLKPRVSKNEEVKQRFRREYEAASRLRHPGVIKVFDFGSSDEGSLYLVMEYHPHPSLGKVLQRKGAFSEARALDLIMDIADALREIHRVGVVHRDLKPDNIVLLPDNSPVILDFGLSKALDFTTMTKTGAIVGTPQYLAPEQLRGVKADFRSDIHALGSIGVEILIGSNPFSAKSVEELASKLLSEDRPRLSRWAPQLGPAWGDFFDKSFALDPRDRYQSLDEVIADLQSIKKRGPKKRLFKAKAVAKAPKAIESAKLAPLRSSAVRGANSKYILPLILVLSLLLVFFITLYSRLGSEGSRSYGVNDLQVTTGPGMARLRWQSVEPYPSRVCYGPAASFKEGDYQELSSGPKPLDTHDLFLEGLEEGEKFSFQILFPNGKKSFLQSFTVPRFRMSLTSAELLEDGELELRWETTHGSEATVHLFFDGSRNLSFEAQGSKGSWRVVVPWRAASLREIVVKTRLSNKGDGVIERALSVLLREALAKRLASLESLRPKKLVFDLLDRLPRTDEKLALAGRYAKLLKKKVASDGLQSDFNGLAKLSFLIFEGGLLDREEVYRSYDAILRFYHLALWSPEVIGRRVIDFPIHPRMGDYALSIDASLARNREIRIIEPTKKRVRLSVNPEKAVFERNKSWQGSFQAPSLASFARAELVFTVTPLGRNFLRISFNDDPREIEVYDRKVLVSSSNPYVARNEGRVDLGAFVTELATVSKLYQRIPLSLLRSGKNRVKITSDTLNNEDASWNLLSILSLSLRLEKSR